jgi:hypothetical protein
MALGVLPASYSLGTEDYFSERKSVMGMKLTTYLHLVLRPRMMTLLPFPHTSLLTGAELITLAIKLHFFVTLP